jgi:uncharacterized protein HemX
MTRFVWDPSAGEPMVPEQQRPPWATPKWEPRSAAVKARPADDAASFEAGRDCGTRVAACLARLSALELVDGSRWWNRRQRRRMAAALEAYAQELESGADADRRHASSGPCLTGPKTFLRSV